MTDFENKPQENTNDAAGKAANENIAEEKVETAAADSPFGDMPPVPQAPVVPPQTPPSPEMPQYHSPFEPPQYGQPPQYIPPQGAPQYAPPQAPPPGYYQQQSVHPAMHHIFTPPAGYQQKSRLAAALLAMTVGLFGVHNFYLGFKAKAVIQLCVSIVFCWLILPIIGMWVWAFIEGILLLVGDGNRRFDGNGVIMKE